MTNIDVKYKLHQVLSLGPLPPHQPPFLSRASISICCRFLLFSALLIRSVSFVQYFGLR